MTMATAETMTPSPNQPIIKKIPVQKWDEQKKKWVEDYDQTEWNGYLIPTSMIELDPNNSAHSDDCGRADDKYRRCFERDEEEINRSAQRYRECWNEPEFNRPATNVPICEEPRLHWVIVNKVAPDKYYVIDNEKYYLIAKRTGADLIPYLYCIVHENLSPYDAAFIASGMNATHAVIPFRTWSERDEVRFLTRWFNEFVRQKKHTEPPKTLDEFLHPGTTPEDEQKRNSWINQYRDSFAFMSHERLWTCLYLGYSGECCLNCKMKDLELDYIREKHTFPSTRSYSDKDDLMKYAMEVVRRERRTSLS